MKTTNDLSNTLAARTAVNIANGSKQTTEPAWHRHTPARHILVHNEKKVLWVGEGISGKRLVNFLYKV